MDENSELLIAISYYKEALRINGGVSAEVIKTGTSNEIECLTTIDGIELHPDILTFYQVINGYDEDRCYELDVYEPELVWGMYPIEAKYVETHYKNAGCGGEENPDYWPHGFLPILEEGGGSYIVVNCIKSSPTYGGVYDMSEGVGCNRVSISLKEFFTANTKVLEENVRYFNDREYSEVKDLDSYFNECRNIFGSTPYFSRVGNMDTQIVDWK